MRYIKRLSAVLTVVIMLVFGSASVYAGENYHVYDLDESLTTEEENLLAAKQMELEENLGLNIAIVITDNLEGKSSEEYADDFYDQFFGINTDGILLLLDNYSSWDHISTSGKAIGMYSDAYIDKIFSAMNSSLKRGDYYKAADKFLDLLEVRNIFWSDFKVFFITGLGAGALIALVTCLIIAHGYKTNKKMSPRNYISENESRFTVKNDRYLRQYTTKVKIESSSSSRGGSGTHTSSHGGTHGGHSHHR